jgi:hypothetical protein
MNTNNCDIRIESPQTFCCNNRFFPTNILVSEKELPVQVTDLNRVKINDGHLPDTGQREAFCRFASDRPGTDLENAGISEFFLIPAFDKALPMVPVFHYGIFFAHTFSSFLQTGHV